MSHSMFNRNSIISWILFIGWFCMPVALYSEAEIIKTNLEGYFWVLGVAFPFYFFITKATVTSLLLLIWVSTVAKFSFKWKPIHWLDLSLIAFVISPSSSLYKNNISTAESIENVLYLGFVWGVPYFIGRLYLSSFSALQKSVEIFLIISLLATPFFLVEFFTSPIFYDYVYGFHPFNSDGELRYINFRPMLLLEHGNQLGMWYSTAAFLAFGFWQFTKQQKILFVKVSYVHHCLFTILLISQSRGAILLYLFGITFTLLLRQLKSKAVLLYLTISLLIVIATSLVFSNQIYSFAKQTSIGQETVQLVKNIGGASLTWRIGKDLQNVQTIKENFFTGQGSMNWNKEGVRSWGAILLILGAFGILSLSSWSSLILYPLFTSVRHLSLHNGEEELHKSWFILIVAITLGLNWLDAFLNSFFIVGILVWAGAIVSILQDNEESNCSG